MRRVFVYLLVLVPAGLVIAQTKALKSYKRAQPPKFTKSDPFYADAFKEGLVGQRPADLNKAASVAAAPGSAAPSSAPAVGSSSGAASGGWSRWISAGTIED